MVPDRERSSDSKLRRALAQLPYFPRAMMLVWSAAGGWTVAWVALLAVQGLLPAATALLSRALVDNLVELVGTGVTWESARPVVAPAILLAGVMLASMLLGSVANWVRTGLSDRVRDYVRALIHAKSAAVDLTFYETPEYYDRLHRAQSEASYRPVALLENVGGLLQNSITMVAMMAVLVPYGLWVPVALVVSTLPGLYVVLRHRRQHHRWWRAVTVEERRAWYFDWLLTTRETAAELRLFGIGARFREAFRTLRARLRAERLQLVRNEWLARLAVNGLALLVAGGVMIWMIGQALQGLATLGDLTLFYQAFNRGQGLMRSLLENLGQVYGNSLFLSDLFDFLALEPQVVDPSEPVAFPERATDEVPGLQVRFAAVGFRYPGSSRDAVSGLNLQIPAGQMAAIVGPNGAGKSTLVKLLCRFYDPQQGSVELDGIDLRDLPLAEVRERITVLFQEPVRYMASVLENVDPKSAVLDGAAVETAVQAAGADEIIARLPAGYETLLGRWFEGGTDLSAGEWQRLALARALLRQAPVIVLDEPTSAMDPWAEADWLRGFRPFAMGRTAIVITHRLTTARLADRIYVMDRGRVVESGSHLELLAQGGRYAQSWRAQSLDPAAPGPAPVEYATGN